MAEKVNYQRIMEDILDQNKKRGLKPSLLLHSCCAPCSSYVLKYLSGHFDITVYYYNPNIIPGEEYLKRLGEQKRLCSELDIPLIVGDYDPEEFYKKVKGRESDPEGGKRCSLCFSLRLDKTAKTARAGEFNYFGTTLTVSPHKNADIINQLGHEAAIKYNLLYLPSDFKKDEGYKKSIELSKEYGLYRQDYCGCKF